MEESTCLDKKKVNILVVGNSPRQAEKLRFQLEKNQYTVFIAENGYQALSAIEVFVPKVIITDIPMPGMNGFELCRKIKEQDHRVEIPVILLTSLSEPEDVIEGMECGADNFITKPCSEEYLLSHVEHIIANRKPDHIRRFCMGVEVVFAGKRSFFKADQIQMLT